MHVICRTSTDGDGRRRPLPSVDAQLYVTVSEQAFTLKLTSRSVIQFVFSCGETDTLK